MQLLFYAMDLGSDHVLNFWLATVGESTGKWQMAVSTQRYRMGGAQGLFVIVHQQLFM